MSAALEQVKEKFARAGTNIGKGLAAGFGAAAGSGVAVAAAGIAAGAASAGLAVRAFTAAAQPQLESVTESWSLYEEAQDAAAKGGQEAAEAQKALKDHLAGLPGPTRDTAESFINLRKDFKAWSDDLSGTTMPVFTKGIEILRDLLPTLTPFVNQAALAISGFLDDVSAGVQSAGFKQWAADMSSAAGPALTNFLTIIKNLAVGFGGLLQAFVPFSSGMTGGLVTMSAAFADWGANLQHTEGFTQFLQTAQNGGGALMNLATAAGNLLVALGPLLGTTAMVANALARIINNTPTPVLTALAAVLASVRVGMMLYSAVAAAVAAKNAIMAASQTRVILGWLRMNAVGVAAMARIAAQAVASAAVTAAAWVGSALTSIGTWIAAVVRAGLTAAGQFVMMAARAVVWAATMAAQWLIAMGPIGWAIAAVIGLTALIIANWDKIKQWTGVVWNWLWAKIKAIADIIWNLFLNWTIAGLIIKHWDKIKSGTVAVWNAVWGFIKGIPGRIVNLFLNWTLPGLIIKHWNRIKSGSIQVATSLVSWVRGLPGRIVRALGNLGSLLYNSGRSIIRGLINGIKNMAGSVKNAVSNVLSAARNLLPFSPAKEGPFSGKGWTLYSGQSMMTGLAQGIQMRARLAVDAMRQATRSTADAGSGSTPGAAVVPRPTTAPAPLLRDAAASGPLVIQLSIAGRDFGQLWIDTGRREVRTRGGNVQAVIGQ